MANDCEPQERRLIGLETEYAVRIDTSDERSHRDVFEEVCAGLAEQVPVAEADAANAGKAGIFLGTGGAVWFESLYPNRNVGLIEGATPEARSAREAVACQRAQDQLLGNAAAEVGVSLVKASHDGAGNPFGSQENYEVEIGSPESLRWWRRGSLLLAAPSLVWALAIIIPLFLLGLAATPVTGLIYLVYARVVRDKQKQRRAFDFWVGRCWRVGWNGVDIPAGGWISRPALLLVQIAALPTLITIHVLLGFTELPKIHRRATAFLITRLLYCGAGCVQKSGRFVIADKAQRIWTICGLSEYARPIFSLGQFLKPMFTFRLRETWNPRQRLQISLADSNMCEVAEYLRVGATSLVIDTICSGEELSLPEFRHPIRALRQLIRDNEMEMRFRLRNGTTRTAIEIQRMYLAACQQFVERDRPDDEEASDILRRWQGTLAALEVEAQSLIGQVDWITKRFLIEQALARQTESVFPIARSQISAARKIDIKYHELTPDGYFNQFARTELQERVLTEDEVDRATRLPPPGTPATTRARLIREFAGTGVQVGWKQMSNGMRIE